MLMGNNLSSNRDNEAGSGYGEYLRGANHDLIDNAAIRAKTPGVVTGQAINTNGSKNSLLMSNDTLRAVGGGVKSGLS